MESSSTRNLPGHGLSGANVGSELETLLSRIEACSSTAEALRVLEDEAAANAKLVRNPAERFVQTVAKPYARGVKDPLFATDFGRYWPRFRLAWDRLNARPA